ncbi:MAG TPA: peroxidase family protein [Candidatus Limnocylindria bacterium]|nr:peroxidase family protein [Candidatus Limnocylindria bacterium]
MAAGRKGEHAYSRRTFLTGLGLGLGAAGAAGVAAGVSLGRVDARLHTPVQGNFSRMFPDLPPFFDGLRVPSSASPAPFPSPPGANDQLRDVMRDIGKLGGLLDAKDAIGAGPVALIANPAVNGNDPPTNPDNPTHTAGVTFFGQFMDLDVTFDSRSTLGTPTDPLATLNMKLAYFDLDTIYGLGPFVTPQYYDVTDPAKLRIENGGIFEDLPRNAEGTAIIPDPRSDQNMMVSGLHCAFILFHNKAVDYVRLQQGLIDPAAIYAEARRLTLWHYHWLILNEFLPLFIGPALVNDILTNGRRFYLPDMGQATMPIEFQGACFRVGHTMIRPSYRANLKGDNGKPFFGFIFDPALGDITPAPGLDPADLRSGFRAPRRFIGWQTFFDFKDGDVKPNKQIDHKISTPLFTLPLGAIASHKAPISLMQRNLLRHITWSMPSGQSIARAIGVDRLSAEDLKELRVYDIGLEENTPLFYYMLKEAALVPDTDVGKNTGGFHLGPVGGRIVGEVVIGLLQSDATSWVAKQPDWTPVLQNPGPGFRMVDFLTFAGVDPATRHAQKPNAA